MTHVTLGLDGYRSTPTGYIAVYRRVDGRWVHVFDASGDFSTEGGDYKLTPKGVYGFGTRYVTIPNSGTYAVASLGHYDTTAEVPVPVLATEPTKRPGLVYYDTTLHALRVTNGTTWTTLGSGGSGVDGYIFRQDEEAGSWGPFDIPDEAGEFPTVAIYIDGELVDAPVTIDNGQITVEFPYPVSGALVLG